MRGKRARLGHGTLLVPVKQGGEGGGVFTAPQHHSGQARANAADTRPPLLPHTLTPLIGAEMAAVRQAISTGDDPQA